MFIVIVPGTSVLNSTTNEAGALTAVVRPSRKVAASKVKGSIIVCECANRAVRGSCSSSTRYCTTGTVVLLATSSSNYEN